MENLLEVLQMIVEKYNVAEEDVAAIQEALGSLESGMNDEFAYPEESVEEPVEE